MSRLRRLEQRQPANYKHIIPTGFRFHHLKIAARKVRGLRTLNCNPMRYYLELHRRDMAYFGGLHQGNVAVAKPLHELQLGPEAEVHIKEQAYALGALVRALIAYQPEDLKIAFEERGQLEIGQYLYRQIFGDTLPSTLRGSQDEHVELRIITDDEHLARLPWVLLAHRGAFLSMTGWSIALARDPHPRDCELPASPKLLIIAPEPAGIASTRANRHLENLEQRLSQYDPRLCLGEHLRIAHTWEQFRKLLKDFQPHAVYYYGHGAGDPYQTRLLFASEQQNKLLEKPIIDFAHSLREMPEPPRLVYLNCCYGDASGLLGAGLQLGEFIPAVITNRTVAHIDAAQAQALALWQSILLEGRPPHLAMSEMYSRLLDMDLSFANEHWMTPVLHGNYAEWKSTPPRRVDPLEHDPHWHLKLDRVSQFGTVFLQTRLMLRERRPRTLAYVWYGAAGQGVEIFHQRLQMELQEDLTPHAHFMDVRPEWPTFFEKDDEEGRAFEAMICEAFHVLELQNIPQAIRKRTLGETGRQVLVYVRHVPMASKLITPRTLKQYLEWWDRKFVPLLQGQHYALLTVSFIVNNPPKFRKAALEDVRLNDLRLHGTVFRLLDEMERIAYKDLDDFLLTHNIALPHNRKERILQDILERTKGHYEMTISELKQVVYRDWNKPEAEDGGQAKPDEQEFDY